MRLRAITLAQAHSNFFLAIFYLLKWCQTRGKNLSNSGLSLGNSGLVGKTQSDLLISNAPFLFYLISRGLSHNFLSDAELANVLTFVRNAWGNQASEVTPEEVAAVRAKNDKS